MLPFFWKDLILGKSFIIIARGRRHRAQTRERERERERVALLKKKKKKKPAMTTTFNETLVGGNGERKEDVEATKADGRFVRFLKERRSREEVVDVHSLMRPYYAHIFPSKQLFEWLSYEGVTVEGIAKGSATPSKTESFASP